MSLYVVLAQPEIYSSLGQDAGPFRLVRVTSLGELPIGDVSLLLRRGELVATGQADPALADEFASFPPAPFEISIHNRESRAAKRESWRRLDLPGHLVPLLCIHAENGHWRVYRRIEAGAAGVLFTAIGAKAAEEESPPKLAKTARQAKGWFRNTEAAFNAGMSHTRWNPGVELERKFTFTAQLSETVAPVDTWRLHQALHRELRAGAWAGFIPEFNEEFHVWDYESEMYEIAGPPEAQGYVAFIPQSDGRVTVKYKRFREDAEHRREDITNNIQLDGDGFSEAAAKISGGDTVRLPGFRRKRFDCDVESLNTGNAYGIFFDICRTSSGPAGLLSQCEVEYLRTRSVAPIIEVQEDFERVCALIRDFLTRHHALHTEGYYSKLSFLREISGGAHS